ncbi:MAG TPA: hypothetical protein P5120_00895 [Spirochaetota bacterium]|nr:hypothetical protein [Spirochaetota bacterium]HPF04525.1 hypothetical protein [Spirochaetota bacterium]HPJ42142.1 hypothetical protein [Spirochaetota bacterium]HPR38742.1 hypothetical protein [Spirochaetota bacterium]HRX46050.1 hypothetical protein [Spirochaetota bacterium]
MNAYRSKKESVRLYQGGRKEQIRQRHSGKQREDGFSGKAEGVYGQLLREFMGTQVDSRGVKLYPAENLI